jgi:hypothetical protein
MSITIENPNGTWLDKILNKYPFAIDTDKIKTIGIVWGFIKDSTWVFKPTVVPNDSLFYNGILFIRFNWPFGIFGSFRWAKDWRRSFLQTGLGYKLNGRFGATIRLQSDESAAEGTSGPNYGQAKGFEYGPH